MSRMLRPVPFTIVQSLTGLFTQCVNGNTGMLKSRCAGSGVRIMSEASSGLCFVVWAGSTILGISTSAATTVIASPDAITARRCRSRNGDVRIGRSRISKLSEASAVPTRQVTAERRDRAQLERSDRDDDHDPVPQVRSVRDPAEVHDRSRRKQSLHGTAVGGFDRDEQHARRDRDDDAALDRVEVHPRRREQNDPNRAERRRELQPSPKSPHRDCEDRREREERAREELVRPGLGSVVRRDSGSCAGTRAPT